MGLDRTTLWSDPVSEPLMLLICLGRQINESVGMCHYQEKLRQSDTHFTRTKSRQLGPNQTD
jgi:hypothetical protein